MKKMRGLISAGGAVDGFLQNQELAPLLRPHLAKARWAEIVGPQVAGVTQVSAVRDGVLIVRVKNSVWANELTLLKDDMLRRLNLALGGKVLTDIHFQAGGLGRVPKKTEKIPAETPTEGELARIALPKEARARVEAALIGITEEALRERIRRTMTRAARTLEWRRRHGWLPCPRCGTLAAPVPISDLDAPGGRPAPVLCHLCRAGIG